MEVLELDGKRYVKASKAAKEAGYTSDYIGQLCRKGAISAHLVGRSWYVDIDALGKHRTTTKRTSRIKAREQVRKALAAKQTNSEAEKHYLSRAPSLSYDRDDSELMPQVRKLSVIEGAASTKRQKHRAGKTSKRKKEPEYEFENAGEKIVMTGTLNVVDVTNDTFDDLSSEDTVLVPKIIKHTAPEQKKRIKQSKHLNVASLSNKAAIKTDDTSSFEQKLAEIEADTKKNDSARVRSVHSDRSAKEGTVLVGGDTKSSYAALLIGTVTLLAICSAVISADSIWSYEAGEQISEGISFDIVSAIENIRLKL